ncbi:LPS-assembly protein LptD [Litoreibacter roseus]|uniref:LPS-assembly protein LptD n=1 Tax=Litoreibacter roseus TaxID=2601869 RepID=A0A6N6JCJ6_9RHOB|nr:LPS assembly protein LptD [Litoreibacter roseus]GFE64053.1 LPS-assembly protein LptD [Litoreibacter roseus]
MRRILCILACVLWSGAAVAQRQTVEVKTATLVADEVTFSSETQVLRAAGNVEVLNDGVRLRAQAISYNGVTDQLTIEGPLYLVDTDGTVIVADEAGLSGDLQAGVLKSARLVFSEQLQVAANEIALTDGRFTQFYKTVASSCHICDEDPVPLWEIRSRRIIYDSETRQIYFNDASLRVLGVPVLYTPYLRLPDPSIRRANGFLTPQIRSNGDIGVGVRTPYFFTLGDHADLTIAPWVTTKGSYTLDGRYRRKFRYAEVEARGAVTRDDLEDGVRSYLFADGTFAAPRGFRGKFDLELTSDPAYLLVYGFSDKDRLDSAVSVERATRKELITAELVYYKSLREDEDSSEIPTVLGDTSITRRFKPMGIGGIASVELEASGSYRRSDEDLTFSGFARDVMRVSAIADWRRNWQLSNGMIVAGQTELRTDVYEIRQENRVGFGDTVEVTPYTALEVRWPMLKQGRFATHLLEPIVQLAWSDDGDRDVANDDSLLVEFDEANLFRFNRFPGADAQEQGARLNLGVTYTRDDPDGWSLGLTVGRILRDEGREQFRSSTGLDGRGSDWLVAAQLKIGTQLNLINRAVFDDGMTFSRNEMRFSWNTEDFNLSSTYAYLEADEQEGRPSDTSEIALSGGYNITPYWTFLSSVRHDFVQGQATRAGLGLRFENECTALNLSVSRRFTSSDIVTATTDFSLSVQLAGFGPNSASKKSFTRQCRG